MENDHAKRDHGHVELIRRLLNHERLDSTADRNDEAIRLAWQNCHTDMIKSLLSNPRLDPNVRQSIDWNTDLSPSRERTSSSVASDDKVVPFDAKTRKIVGEDVETEDQEKKCATRPGEPFKDFYKDLLILPDGRYLVPVSHPVVDYFNELRAESDRPELDEDDESPMGYYPAAARSVKMCMDRLKANTVGWREVAEMKEIGGEDVQTDDEEKECVVCQENEKRCAAQPCGHRCLCIGCANELLARSEKAKCPMCRREAEGFLKIYD